MKSKKGFTLIELLIVIAIIAVLAVAFLPQVLGAPSKGRDAQRLAQMQKLQQFLTAESVSGAGVPASSACLSAASADGNIVELITKNLSDFGGVFPKDPQDGNNKATGAPGECTGYGYVKFATPKTAGFTAAFYVAMENVENANMKCSLLKADASAVVTLTPGKSGADTSKGEVGCYVALIQ